MLAVWEKERDRAKKGKRRVGWAKPKKTNFDFETAATNPKPTKKSMEKDSLARPSAPIQSLRGFSDEGNNFSMSGEDNEGYGSYNNEHKHEAESDDDGEGSDGTD